MAEAAVEFLIGSIGSLLEKEVALLGSVRGEINELKLELESIRSFLKDAEKCKDLFDGVRNWVEQVRDVAYKAEDAIDEFMYYMDYLRGGGGGFKGFLRRFLHLPKEVFVKHRTAIKLQGISAEIRSIAERRQRYELGPLEAGQTSHGTPRWLQNLQDSSFFIKDEDFVGMENDKASLMKWLKEDVKQRTVISVVGMGGSGKTTLVAKAYNSKEVKRFFDCCAWVTLSQENYLIEDLLRRMIEQFFDGGKAVLPPRLRAMDYQQLVKTLLKYLQRKRYVIVLDNVWNLNFWSRISFALPEDTVGSRIILTTRNEEIASYPYGAVCHVLRPHPLQDTHSLTLFCKKAFASDPNNRCPPELDHLARELVQKCGGLPLAVAAMGGLMASKEKSELKWREVNDSFNYYIDKNPMLDMVKTVLLLSFNDLPYYLRNCFLYGCLFPVNYWIAGRMLIRLWIAEGFVEEEAGRTPEEVGKSYLKELISRSLLQVAKKKNYLKPQLCKLHDLMREIALSVSKQDHLCCVYDPQRMLDEERRARRFSLNTGDIGELQRHIDMSQVRSFFAFLSDRGSSTYALDPMFLSNLRLVKVLELRDAPIKSVPETIGKLFNLRYLSLRGTLIKELPKSLGRLVNLQTLDLQLTEVRALPAGIVKLQNLRHLLAYGDTTGEEFTLVKGVQVPADIWKLKNLQVLNCVEANSEIIRGIGNMTQLKWIHLTKVREEDESALCASLEKLKLLRHLLVAVANEEETLRMDALSSPPPALRKLILVGRLNSVPPWFTSLRNVAHLHLHWSQLTEEQDPIPSISALPSLKRLFFINAFGHGKKQLCFHEGFPKLEHLSLVVFSELIDITIEKGVMPGLTTLTLQVCAKLKKVPEGIEHLTNLEELYLKDVSEELVNSIRGEESFDRPRVRHIPVINHYYKTASDYTFESLSSGYITD